ncbi:hypothetical protein [Ornithinimicrobium kibberense]|uniref:hypothetical protein n=1 Tax=Ornithinimicrobium kibberense TaxID=282060 RepID=UPI0036161FC8
MVTLPAKKHCPRERSRGHCLRHESEPGLLAGDLDPGPLVVPCVLKPPPGREVDNRADSG